MFLAQLSSPLKPGYRSLEPKTENPQSAPLRRRMGLRSHRRSRRKLQKFQREFSLADEIISKTTANLKATKYYETDSLIQDDHCRSPTSADRRLCHHQQQFAFAIRGRLQTAPRRHA